MAKAAERQPDYSFILAWLRSHEPQVLAFYRSEFEKTGSPLWVWEALDYVTEIRDCALKVGETFTDLIVPSWCAGYLKQAAGNLLRLADGSPLAKTQAGKRRVRQDPADDRLSLTEARNSIPAALGFFGVQGASAFSRHRNAIEDELLYFRFEDLRRIGRSYEEAIAELQGNRPTTEASGLAKRITAGKQRVERRHKLLPPYKPPVTGES